MSEDSSRREQGLQAYASQLGMSEAEVEDYFVSTFGRVFAEEAFQATGGAAWGDGPLSLRERSLIVIAILASLGGVEQRLVGHVRWAIDHGATADEVRSTMTLVANYAGFARASVAMEVANRELDRLDGSDDGVETTWRERW
jgi:alkylhydroperoxidase/carboxymuconolactone decarboxylase family protein YurZ